MSSFRPQLDTTPPSFVPRLLHGADASSFGSPQAEREDVGPAPVEGLDPLGASPETADESAPTREAAILEPTAEAAPAVDVAALEQAAYERGLAEGRAEAADFDRAAEALERAAQQWEEAAGACVSAHRERALDLCRDAVERWVGEELALDPERFADLLDEARPLAEDGADVRLLVSTQDLAALESGAAARVAAWRAEPKLALAADDALEPGDFRLVAGALSLDGRRSVVAARLRAHWDADGTDPGDAARAVNAEDVE